MISVTALSFSLLLLLEQQIAVYAAAVPSAASQHNTLGQLVKRADSASANNATVVSLPDIFESGNHTTSANQGGESAQESLRRTLIIAIIGIIIVVIIGISFAFKVIAIPAALATNAVCNEIKSARSLGSDLEERRKSIASLELERKSHTDHGHSSATAAVYSSNPEVAVSSPSTRRSLTLQIPQTHYQHRSSRSGGLPPPTQNSARLSSRSAVSHNGHVVSPATSYASRSALLHSPSLPNHHHPHQYARSPSAKTNAAHSNLDNPPSYF